MDVVRVKINRFREGNGGGFQGIKKGKRRASVKFELIFSHPCFSVVCACIDFFGEASHFTEGADYWSCVSSAKS